MGRMSARLIAIGVATVLALAVASLGLNSARAEPCEGLTGLKLAHVTITSAKRVAATPSLAAYCKVLGTARPTADSDIRFEVAIPEGPAWNGRYLQKGNGGFAGGIPENSILLGVAQGYATAGTDDGHQANQQTDASWALGHPEKVIDFGHRALRETTVAAKAIIAAYERRGPKFSYFDGCSDGGREALMEAQRYPDDFDGIVAGDPANNWARLMAAAAANGQALTATPASALTPAKLRVLEAAALRACGDEDGIVENPPACRFDPSVAACKGADGPDCLNPEQVEAARRIYAGARDPRTGARILAGFGLGGEAEPGGWEPWITGTGGQPDRALLWAFSRNFYAYVAFGDPGYDIRRLNLDADARAAEAKAGPILNAYDPNLAAFRRHGGKLIQYHGWADAAIPAGDSVDYFEAVQARMGDTSGFYRLFLAPGMLHCSGGRGPNLVNKPALDAIVAWVEHGQAPSRLLIHQDVPAVPGKPAFSRDRPLCAWPKVAEWDGRTDRSRAEAWTCKAPSKRARGA